MIERLIAAVAIVMIGVVAWVAYNRWSIRQLASSTPTDPLLVPLQQGIPAVIYFTTPFCEPCRTLQRPTLDQLKAELGGQIQIVQIDGMEQPDVADRWGVMSVPTTFILDGDHKPRTVNRGVASLETLKKQLFNVA
jgi:thiol-disulfide isomerase/thioredoxin